MFVFFSIQIFSATFQLESFDIPFFSSILSDGFGRGPSAVHLVSTKGEKDFFQSFFWHPVASRAHSDSVHPSGLTSS